MVSTIVHVEPLLTIISVASETSITAAVPAVVVSLEISFSLLVNVVCCRRFVVTIVRILF